MRKSYVILFIVSSMALTFAILYFATRMNPERITNAPWSIDFVADRNMAYKKFSLLKDNVDYTDLFVGSSTSEAFVPQVVEHLYGVKNYLAGTGGSKTPYRLAQINYAIKNNPNLKRIIYTVDLFEFTNTDLETKIYYQPEIMAEIPSDLKSKLSAPDFVSRIQDYFNFQTIQSSVKTFKDYSKYKMGSYESQFLPDGSTKNAMVIVDRKEPIAPRALRIAKGYEAQYKNFKKLDPITIKFFEEITGTAKARGLEIVFIIAPWHSLFYDHFKDELTVKTDVYAQFVDYIKGLRAEHVRVIDYSYPVSQTKGILDSEEFWDDGIHFSRKSAEIILNDVYKTDR